MKRGSWIAASVVAGCVVACSSSGDVCSRVLSISTSQENALAACLPADAGFNANPDGGLATCEAELTHCSSSDIGVLNSELDCLQGLSPFQCKWVTESPEAQSMDSSYLAYQAAAANCVTKSSQLSPACADAGG